MKLKKVVLWGGVVAGICGVSGVGFGEGAATQGAATQARAHWPAPETKPYSRQPKSRNEILEMSPDLEREELMTILANGNQCGAEALLPELVKKHPEDQG